MSEIVEIFLLMFQKLACIHVYELRILTHIVLWYKRILSIVGKDLVLVLLQYF